MRFLLLSTLGLALFPTSTLACGGFFCEPQRPVLQSGEAIVFGVNGDSNQVTMQVQILYQGPAEAFSWVLPLPVVPDAISVGSDLLFRSLFQQTLPRWQLEVLNETASDTCDSTALEFPQCLARDTFVASAADEEGAVVLEQGSVGPFDFVVLEAAENDPTSVLTWLNENGYDQMEGSGPLLNFYAANNHVFVALRLQKQAETGEIQPLILTYTMPVSEDTTQISRRAMACVPIQLTRIAATENMPIQVYILGQARAVPLNFVEIQLDDTKADWLTCQGNDACFYDDYMDRFDSAASQLVNHSFVTEYAGTSSVMAGTIEIQDVTEEMLAQTSSLEDFNQTYRALLPTDLPLVDTIIQDYADTNPFDAAGLAAELEAKVLKPARDAQAFVDGHAYLTRMYARLSPDFMTKDPFFAFKPELPDVSNMHNATAIPVCTDIGNGLEPSALIIQVDGYDPFQLPATTGCNGWAPIITESPPIITSHALQVSSWGFEGDLGVIVLPSADGSFDAGALKEAVDFGDSLVMNQTIPEFTCSDPCAAASSDGGGGSESTKAPGSLAWDWKGVVRHSVLLCTVVMVLITK
jgi:hypothetical protein